MIVGLPPGTGSLSMTVTPSGWTTDLTYLWELVSGDSGAVTIDDPTANPTDVTITSLGSYVFKLTVTQEQTGEFLLVDDPADTALTTEDGDLFAVEGYGGGFAPELVVSALLNVTVVATGLVVAPEPILVGGDFSLTINDVEYALIDEDATDEEGGPYGVVVHNISETDDENPNTMSFEFRGFTANYGDRVNAFLTFDDDSFILLFSGLILRLHTAFNERWENRFDQAECVDHSWHLHRRRINQNFIQKRPHEIVADIMAVVPGFSVAYAQTGFDPITISLDSSVPEALNELCQNYPGTTWKVDYNKALHWGQLDTSVGQPDPLTYSHESIQDFAIDKELGTWITKLRVYGASASAADEITLTGNPELRIQDDTNFGNEGSSARISGIRPEESDPDYETVPDRFDTSFLAV